MVFFVTNQDLRNVDALPHQRSLECLESDLIESHTYRIALLKAQYDEV